MAKELKTITRVEPFAGYRNLIELINAQQEAIDAYAQDPDKIDFEVISTTVGTSDKFGTNTPWYGTMTYRFKK